MDPRLLSQAPPPAHAVLTPETARPVVFYDETCPLCRSLAELLAARADGKLDFASWQQQTGEVGPAPRLALRRTGELLVGAAAWQAVVEIHPSLSGLGWLAGRLGLGETLGRALEGGGSWLRRWCRDCGSPLRRRR